MPVSGVSLQCKLENTSRFAHPAHAPMLSSTQSTRQPASPLLPPTQTADPPTRQPTDLPIHPLHHALTQASIRSLRSSSYRRCELFADHACALAPPEFSFMWL